MSPEQSYSVLLTYRALRDIESILEYSTERWNREIAESYVHELQSALQRISERPELLRPVHELHESLCFYRVKKHLLACDLQASSIVVLTVLHASMDIPARLAELEPTLATEIEMLHRQLSQRGSQP